MSATSEWLIRLQRWHLGERLALWPVAVHQRRSCLASDFVFAEAVGSPEAAGEESEMGQHAQPSGPFQ